MKLSSALIFLTFTLTACQQKPVPSPTSPPLPCETPPDTLLVEGYYSIDSSLVRLNIQPDANGKWCYLPAGKQATASCPGWDGFIALLDEPQRLFSIESPLKPIITSGLPISIWADPLCPYPGAFDNGNTGSVPGNRYYAMMQLSEPHLNCLLQEGGFWFQLKVLQSKH